VRSSTHWLAAHLRGGWVAIVATLVMGAQVSASAASTLTWAQALGVPATAPANAAREAKVRYEWGACPTVGSCAAVGSYKDEDGNEQAMAATRTNGSWAPPVEIMLPPGAASSGQVAGFGEAQATVVCTGPGACVAVGHYITEANGEELMVVTETGGVWSRASKVQLPANAASNPQARLRAVACPTAGSCVASGEYLNESDHWEAVIATETNGSWGPARDIELPESASSEPTSSLGSVACSAVGSCVAIGEYSNGSVGAQEAMVVSETSGSWDRASQLELPANKGSTPRSYLHSVVCVASGPCVAAGVYTDSSNDREAMVAEETGGSWDSASEIAPPANAASNPSVDFGVAASSMVCPASGSCVVILGYTDGAGGEEAMVAEGTGGSWGPASEITLPVNVASNPHAALYPACPASGACVAIGQYTDEGGDREVIVAEGIDGQWGPASAIAAPANAATRSEVIVGEVQCPASGACIAFGEFKDNVGVTQGMEVMTVPGITLAPIVTGTAKVGQVLTCSEGTWTGSPVSYAYKWLRDGIAIGGAESNTYTVTAADEGHRISCEVTATGPLGDEGAASSESVAIHEEVREKREEEETALISREEGEAAEATKRQEEAKVALASRVSFTGSIIRVGRDDKASVRLTCAGVAPCTGKLTLMVNTRAKKRKKARAETIGTVAFSVPAGKSKVVTIRLAAAGRTLLKADHGRLSASLTILNSSLAPTSTEHESVRLVLQKAIKAKKRT
jgi:hypothetical protein